MQTLKLISVLIILCIGHSIHAAEVDIFKGMKLYAENCAGCHMGNLAGHEEWDKSLDEDVWSILEFIKSTWPEKILNKYNSHFKS